MRRAVAGQHGVGPRRPCPGRSPGSGAARRCSSAVTWPMVTRLVSNVEMPVRLSCNSFVTWALARVPWSRMVPMSLSWRGEGAAELLQVAAEVEDRGRARLLGRQDRAAVVDQLARSAAAPGSRPGSARSPESSSRCRSAPPSAKAAPSWSTTVTSCCRLTELTVVSTSWSTVATGTGIWVSARGIRLPARR